MSTVTIRPNGFVQRDGIVEATTDGGSTWATPTDANIATYLGDASDLTGIRSSSGTSRTVVLTLPAPLIASDEFVARVSGTVRWSAGVSSKYVGVAPYVRSGSVPSSWSTVSTGGSITTSEPGYVAKAWSLTEVANLGVSCYLDGSDVTAQKPLLWDAAVKVYTLKLATAVPTATTMTTSTYATIPVAVTATIDWEASTLPALKLRTVTADVRVEQGGTTVGTGTLVTTGSADILFSATGTQTVNVTCPDSLLNGTYRVYARAVRHRESESSVASDQYGTWSSGVTLTMSRTPPTAPLITATVNEGTDSVTVSITPVATTGYTSPYVSLERSDDAGSTWGAVRGATAVSATFGTASTFTDYEAARFPSTCYYRAKVSAYVSGVLNTSQYATSAAVNINVDTWNLKVPQAPQLNITGALVTGNPAESMSEDLGIYRPDGRSLPIVVSGTLSGRDGSLEVITTSAAEWAALLAVIKAQAILLLESPFGWSKYVRLSSGAQWTNEGTSTQPRRRVQLSYVETSSPQEATLVLPQTITIIYDAGTSSAYTPTATVDGGASSTTTFTDTYDFGSSS